MARHTDTDAQLIELIQRDFPLVSNPYEEIATQLSIEPADVISTISRLKTDGIIRQIGAIFDSSALGYQSALVAFKVKDEYLDKVGQSLALNPCISHCYSRQANYNLWFTVTVPPEGDLEQEVIILAEMDGIESFLLLPALRVYKIGVFFRMTDEPNDLAPATISTSNNRYVLSTEEKAAVRALQKDLPLINQPFKQLADDIGISEEKLLEYARFFIKTGIMRRFAAVLRHTRAGYMSNAMICWNVSADMLDQIGQMFADNPAVSHCYERPTFPDWPYSLYTMIHARSESELNAIIQGLAASSGLSEYQILHSLKEYKKSRVLYFID